MSPEDLGVLSGKSPSESWRRLQEYRRRGSVSPEAYERLSGLYGLHRMRSAVDGLMLRIKLPAGAVTPGQLRCAARIMEDFCAIRTAHITTRQDLEVYGIQEEKVGYILNRLEDAGLTSIASGGNTVRNISCCPLSGLGEDHPFDLAPLAMELHRRFSGTEGYSNLPRKFKIALEGCADDHALVSVQDIGIQAIRSGTGISGFAVLVGGGLGGHPAVGQRLEPLTRVDQLIPTVEAVLRVFDRHGNRRSRFKARLKFLVKEWGIDRFRSLVIAERERVEPSKVGLKFDTDWPRGLGDRDGNSVKPLMEDEAFRGWTDQNVVASRVRGLVGAWIQCPMGDVSSGQLLAIADASERFAGGRLRTSQAQNVLLRWVSEEKLPELYSMLQAAGLGAAGVNGGVDVTRCVGGEVCKSSIASSRTLALRIREILQKDRFRNDPEVQKVGIRVSGCPHGCSRHALADIGLRGHLIRVGAAKVTCFKLLVGGDSRIGRARFATEVSTIPDFHAAQAVERILDYYSRFQAGETFFEFLSRVGTREVGQLVRNLEIGAR